MPFANTAEFQWLEYAWNHENKSEVVPAIQGKGLYKLNFRDWRTHFSLTQGNQPSGLEPLKFFFIQMAFLEKRKVHRLCLHFCGSISIYHIPPN